MRGHPVPWRALRARPFFHSPFRAGAKEGSLVSGPLAARSGRQRCS
jgi:hypothetical protein